MSRYPALFSPPDDQAPAHPQPAAQHQPCSRVRGGRTHHGTLSALSGGEGARRRGAHPVRRRHRGIDRELLSLRADQRGERRSRPRVPRDGGPHSRARGCLHGPAHPRRAPRALGQRPLAARFFRLLPPGAHSPLLSGRDGASRHRPYPAGLRAGGAPGTRGRSRRGRDLVPGRHTDRAVLVARVQPPRGRIRRIPRESHALRVRAAGGGAARGRTRFHRGHSHARGRTAGRRSEPRRLPRDCESPCAHGQCRLHQRGRGAGLGLQIQRKDLADDVGPHRPVSAHGECDQGGSEGAGVSRHPGRTLPPPSTRSRRGTST